MQIFGKTNIVNLFKFKAKALEQHLFHVMVCLLLPLDRFLDIYLSMNLPMEKQLPGCVL